MYGSSAYVHHGFLDAWNYLKNDKNAINMYLINIQIQKIMKLRLVDIQWCIVSTLMMADFMSNQTQTPGLFTTTSIVGKRNYICIRWGNQEQVIIILVNHLLINFLIFLVVNHIVLLIKQISYPISPDGNTLGAHYHHISNEVWIAPNGTTYVCNGSGEDPSCSDSLKITQLKPSDHTGYYGLNAGPVQSNTSTI